MSKNYKEEVLKLVASMMESAEDQEEKEDFAIFLEDRLNSMPDYFNTVVTIENRLAVARFKCDDPEEFQEIVTNLDFSRRVKHDAMIASITALNRQCRRFGLTPLYEGDETDRWEMADFCEEFCCDIFSRRYSGKGSAYADGKAIDAKIRVSDVLGKEI